MQKRIIPRRRKREREIGGGGDPLEGKREDTEHKMILTVEKERNERYSRLRGGGALMKKRGKTRNIS